MLEARTVVLAGRPAPLLRALALGLGEAGAFVCFGHAGEGTEFADAVEQIRGRDGRAVALDRPAPRNGQEADACVAAARAELGRIDVLVNGIGPVPSGAFLDMSCQGWTQLLAGTFDGTFLWTQAVARSMSMAGAQGTIINIVPRSNDAQAIGFPFVLRAQCDVTVALTSALAAELADRGIRINAIIDRPYAPPEDGSPAAFEEVVRTAAFLCAAQGTCVTGEAIRLGVGMAAGFAHNGLGGTDG